MHNARYGRKIQKRRRETARQLEGASERKVINVSINQEEKVEIRRKSNTTKLLLQDGGRGMKIKALRRRRWMRRSSVCH